MSADPTTQAANTELLEEGLADPTAVVLSWRVEQLIAAGYESDAAFVLALDPDVDLHVATELVRRGCPPNTAFRILV